MATLNMQHDNRHHLKYFNQILSIECGNIALRPHYEPYD